MYDLDLFSGKKNVKNLIVDLLTENGLLTARQIYSEVQKTGLKSVTFQAVYKALKELTVNHVIEKKGKEFALKVDWLNKIEQKTQKIKQNYSSQQLAQLVKNKQYVLEFETVMEIADFLFEYFFQYPNPECKPLICKWKHAYSIVGVKGAHLNVLKMLFQKNGAFILTATNFAPDKYFAQIFEALGAKIKLGKIPVPEFDIFVLGDYVCEIHWDLNFMKEWSQAYNVNAIKDFDFEDELRQMTQSKGKNHVIVLQNKELAEQIRTRIFSYFKKERD